MKKLFIILLTGFVMASCGSETKEEAPTEAERPDAMNQGDSTEVNSEETSEPEHEEIKSFSHSDYNGVIVAQTLSGRKEPGVDGEKIASFSLGEQVKILESTKDWDVIEGNETGACEGYGYKWHKIENSEGTQAWVYGKYLFEKSKQGKIIGKKFNYYNDEWTFGSAVALSYGSSDSDGLTGCDDLELLYFANKSSSKVFPIFVDKKMNYSGSNHVISMFDSKLLMLLSGEGGGADIESVQEANPEEVEIQMTNGYQDGMNESTVYVAYSNGKFKLTRIENTERSY